MSEKLFNLVFSGDLVKGSNEDAVKANLVRLFKFVPEQVDKMFSGRVITIKKNIDAETGRKLRAKFKQAGAVCRLESFSTTSVTSRPSSNPDQTEAKVEVKAKVSVKTNPSVSGPAVFKIPDDPVEEKAATEPDSASSEVSEPMESQPSEEKTPLLQADLPVSQPVDPSQPENHSPAVVEERIEEEGAAEPVSESSEVKDSLETRQSEESPPSTEVNTNSEPLVFRSPVEIVEEVSEDISGNEHTETPSSGLTIAPPGADVLEGYESPEPPPPPNVDGLTIAPPGTDLLDVKKVVQPVEVDISALSLVKEEV